MHANKKTIQLVFFSLLSVTTITAATDYPKIGNLYYDIYTQFARVVPTIDETPYSGDIVIPDTIEYNGKKLPVREIAEKTFANSPDIASIVIPKTIKTIYTGAVDNIQHLDSIIIEDTESTLTIKKLTTSSSPTYAISKCNIGKIHVGREATGTSGLFAYCTIDSITYNKDFLRIPQSLTNLCTLSDRNNGDLYIPEGITEIGYETLDFTNLKRLFLPSTIVSLGRYDTSTNSSDGIIPSNNLQPAAVLICKMKVPPVWRDDLIYSNRTKLDKIIIPKGSRRYYDYYNWNRAATTIEEYDFDRDDEAIGGDDNNSTEITDPVFITINQPAGEETGFCNPRYTMQRGGEISIPMEVQEGWKLIDATLTQDIQEPTEPEVTDDDDDVATEQPEYEITIEEPTETNIHTIKITGLSQDSHLSYILEEETPTEIETIANGTTANAKVRLLNGEIVINTAEATTLHIYTIDGLHLQTKELLANSETTIDGLASGIYLLRTGDRTLRISL